MKSILEKDFKYTPSKDQGPRYMEKRMQEYRDRVKAEAKEPKKVIGEIKPKVKGKV